MIQGICQTTIAFVGGREGCQQYGLHSRASRASLQSGTQSGQYTFGHHRPLRPAERKDRTGHEVARRLAAVHDLAESAIKQLTEHPRALAAESWKAE